MLLATARELGSSVLVFLASIGASKYAITGETRRGCPLVSELHVLVSGIPLHQLRAKASKSPLFKDVWIERKQVRAQFANPYGENEVRFQIVKARHWHQALFLSTADAAHLAWLRRRAKARGTGLWRVTRRARTEEQVYKKLGTPALPPELREGPSPRVPTSLLAERAVRGIFHVHSNWSDGAGSLDEMVITAGLEGFDYVGISDHSKAAVYARGLDEGRLALQALEIRKLRQMRTRPIVFHGIEVDILPDGSLDLPDVVLAELDFVIASVHAQFDMSVDQMTARLVRAVSHPLVTILGHPTARLLTGYPGYKYDLIAVGKAAAANRTCLEVNANAHRLDLSGTDLEIAARTGVSFVINPDAHSPRGIADTWLGVSVARRAGLSKSRILNTFGANEMVAYLEQRRQVGRAKLGLLSAPELPASSRRVRRTESSAPSGL